MVRIKFLRAHRQYRAGDVADVAFDGGMIRTMQQFGRVEILDDPDNVCGMTPPPSPESVPVAPESISGSPDCGPVPFAETVPNKAMAPEQVRRKRGRPRKNPL